MTPMVAEIYFGMPVSLSGKLCVELGCMLVYMINLSDQKEIDDLFLFRIYFNRSCTDFIQWKINCVFSLNFHVHIASLIKHRIFLS